VVWRRMAGEIGEGRREKSGRVCVFSRSRAGRWVGRWQDNTGGIVDVAVVRSGAARAGASSVKLTFSSRRPRHPPATLACPRRAIAHAVASFCRSRRRHEDEHAVDGTTGL